MACWATSRSVPANARLQGNFGGVFVGERGWVTSMSGAPIGFMALSFTAMAELDTALSAGAVSLSILAGLFWIPLLMLVF